MDEHTTQAAGQLLEQPRPDTEYTELVYRAETLGAVAAANPYRNAELDIIRAVARRQGICPIAARNLVTESLAALEDAGLIRRGSVHSGRGPAQRSWRAAGAARTN